MDLDFQIASIDDVKWESQVKDLPELERSTRTFTMIGAEKVPDEMLRVPLTDFIYLAGEVSALTLRSYLESQDPSTSLVRLAETDDRSKFCPVPPQYFKNWVVK